jgi:hypothetical protein
MALTIETGSGVAGADSYATVAQLDAYVSDFWGGALTQTGTEKEAALRRAAIYMDGLSWKGKRTTGRVQGLAWPRADVVDADGVDVPDDVVPAEVLRAQTILARVEAISPGALSPSVVKNEAVKRERVDVIEVEYADPLRTLDAFRPYVTQAMDILGGLLSDTGGVTFLDRA